MKYAQRIYKSVMTVAKTRMAGEAREFKPLFFITLCLLSSTCFAKQESVERKDWQIFFDQHKTSGTVLVVDDRNEDKKTWAYNRKRAHKRYSPASTFKLPHTLFALDAGLIQDEFQVFPWDRVKRSYEPHNQDQNLRSAMRYSAVWVYTEFAKQLGEDRAKSYLQKIKYGNMDPSTNEGVYWVNGKLAISTYEQVQFLTRLYRNQLPFRVEHQRLLKDVMVLEARNQWILRAKTGWQGRHGWWVGWVEWPTGPVFVALNIDTPNGMKDLYKREAIVRGVLASLEALPTQK